MVLYHIVTSYHLLHAMVISALTSEESVLVIPNWREISDLKGFFKTIVPVDISYAQRHSLEETENYYTGLLGDLEEYSSYYIWGAHYSLGMLLAQKKVPFIYCEEAAGMLSRPELLEHNCTRLGLDVESKKKLGLFDGTCNCSAILCNLSAQTGAPLNNGAIRNFDIVAKLKDLPDAVRNRIITYFLPNQLISIDRSAALLLTQHFANLNTLSFEDQVLIYQMFVDYFLPGRNLAIKPHPDDLMYYHQLFPEAQVIREKFPSEFMPFLFDNQPDCVATISSTAIYNLRGHYPAVLELDNRYERDFPMTHRYYAAVCLAQIMGKPLACVGANEVLVQRLIDTFDGGGPALKESVSEAGVILVDDLTEQGENGRRAAAGLLEHLDPKSAVIFINSQMDYCWYDYDRKDLWGFITPVVLEKKIRRPEGQDFYADPSAEVIYFYTKNEEMRHMAQTAHIQKELPHTGIDWEQSVMTEDQERIKVLEGILAATEKRLLYYIEKEREAGGKSK